MHVQEVTSHRWQLPSSLGSLFPICPAKASIPVSSNIERDTHVCKVPSPWWLPLLDTLFPQVAIGGQGRGFIWLCLNWPSSWPFRESSAKMRRNKWIKNEWSDCSSAFLPQSSSPHPAQYSTAAMWPSVKWQVGWFLLWNISKLQKNLKNSIINPLYNLYLTIIYTFSKFNLSF